MILHVETLPITAAEIAENCPARLTELGQRIAAHLEKAARCDQKANDHRISAGRLLAEAKKLCDEGGFAAFHERFCPNLGKSRTYELLAIASGRKSLEQSRAINAERNRKHRAEKKRGAAEAVHHVMESVAKSPGSPRPTTHLQIAKQEAKKARAEVVARMFAPETKTIPIESREALIKALQGLAAESAADRASAALAVERERASLSLTWPELIVPAAVETVLGSAARPARQKAVGRLDRTTAGLPHRYLTIILPSSTVARSIPRPCAHRAVTLMVFGRSRAASTIGRLAARF